MEYGQVVDYSLMDPYKRAAQQAALATSQYLALHGFEELTWTRGESVYVVRRGDECTGFVVEGLGTKNEIGDTMAAQESAYDEFEYMSPELASKHAECVGIDNAAMCFNDMATLGVHPTVFGQHMAVGDSGWFRNERRGLGYIEGTVKACHEVKCSWGCGETPTLRGIIMPPTSELSGASWGVCSYEHLFKANIRHGNHIILCKSSGLHANGLTLCREIAATLPNRYYTKMSNGELYGNALLVPTTLYSPMIAACQKAGVKINYAVNITGHGWAKLMRATEPFAYIIHTVPKPQPIFDFIRDRGDVTLRNMYKTFNMGAGFALIVEKESATEAVRVVTDCGIEAIDGGRVEKLGDTKMVDILPLHMAFGPEDVAVR